MSVNLQKGQKVNLSKDNAGLSKIMVGLGWDEAQGVSFGPVHTSIDCDASAIMLRGGRFTRKEDLIYYGNLNHYSGSVVHMGDNLTGAGDGDDEQICVDLNGVPQDVDRIVFVVNIFAARERMQHFGMIQNAFIRLVNADNNNELYRYNLSENYSGLTAMIFGEVYRHNGEWKFSALGQGTNDMSITEVSQRYQ